MAIRALEWDTESPESGQPMVTGPLVERDPRDAARPGTLSRIFNGLAFALLALGQVNLFGLPVSSLDRPEELTEQEREWLELNLRYDLHM
jgi:hypothetical protein